MNELRLNDRAKIDSYLSKIPQKTFYHYFPLILAISESSDKKMWLDDENSYINLIVGNVVKELYLEPLKPNFMVNRIYVSPNKCPYQSFFKSELYDSNFIYDLETTINIKNFKANVKKFEQRNHQIYITLGNYQDDLEVIKEWYKKRPNTEFTDFGYTLWLIKNYQLFNDLHPNVVYLGKEPVCFSLWGELDDETAVHIISKDKGIPYLQDYIRMKVYKEMLEKGFKYVNDGGDAGSHELRRYKQKLRPKFILPIWSWRKIKR